MGVMAGQSRRASRFLDQGYRAIDEQFCYGPKTIRTFHGIAEG